VAGGRPGTRPGGSDPPQGTPEAFLGTLAMALLSDASTAGSFGPVPAPGPGARQRPAGDHFPGGPWCPSSRLVLCARNINHMSMRHEQNVGIDSIQTRT
jgi:hypothetical protein